MVKITSKHVGDENYWEGETSGKRGLFPHQFVKKPKYKALYEFEAEAEDELNLVKGQVCFEPIGEYIYFIF